MRRPSRRPALAPLLITVVATLAGCSGGGSPDPGEVARAALDRQNLLREPVGPAEVEVSSLGYNDAALQSRTVAIDAATHRDVLKALAGAPGARGEPGLVGLARDLEFRKADEGRSIDPGGGRLDVVTGSIDAADLVAALRRSGSGTEGVGGVGEVDRNLVRADFALYTEGPRYDFRGLDLILVQDDPENALPPSRIRFRLPGG